MLGVEMKNPKGFALVMVPAVGFVLAFVFFVIMSGIVHDDISVTYENRSVEDLFGDINGGGFEKIKRGDTQTISHRLSDDEDRNRIEITVKTTDGDVVFSQVFSRDELDEMDNTIVLEESLIR